MKYSSLYYCTLFTLDPTYMDVFLQSFSFENTVNGKFIREWSFSSVIYYKCTCAICSLAFEKQDCTKYLQVVKIHTNTIQYLGRYDQRNRSAYKLISKLRIIVFLNYDRRSLGLLVVACAKFNPVMNLLYNYAIALNHLGVSSVRLNASLGTGRWLMQCLQ
jgi:hypothetical protein